MFASGKDAAAVEVKVKASQEVETSEAESRVHLFAGNGFGKQFLVLKLDEILQPTCP